MAKNTPRQPEKISADCPHCGFSQLESAYAKSTFCRKCGEHYSIEKLLLKETESLKGPSLFDKLSKMLGRETVREVACLSCKHRQQISSAAQSSLCPACGSYIDLRDFKIAGPFGRTIQTQGEVVITSKGDASSTRIVCREALVEGQVRGTLTSTGAVRVKMRGKMLGSIEAHQLIIEKRADVEFIRPLKVNSMEGEREGFRARGLRKPRDHQQERLPRGNGLRQGDQCRARWRFQRRALHRFAGDGASRVARRRPPEWSFRGRGFAAGVTFILILFCSIGLEKDPSRYFLSCWLSCIATRASILSPNCAMTVS